MHQTQQVLRVIAAVIVNASGDVLLVRKRGTTAFMQPGGKPRRGEIDLHALKRELQEELGCRSEATEADYLGCFRAAAANELGAVVEANVYRARVSEEPTPQAEIAELLWLAPDARVKPPLAPLTEHHVLPICAAALPRREGGAA
jgi:8-oxo-dGTP diphosphatase